jgi:hypothetical protein
MVQDVVAKSLLGPCFSEGVHSMAALVNWAVAMPLGVRWHNLNDSLISLERMEPRPSVLLSQDPKQLSSAALLPLVAWHQARGKLNITLTRNPLSLPERLPAARGFGSGWKTNLKLHFIWLLYQVPCHLAPPSFRRAGPITKQTTSGVELPCKFGFLPFRCGDRQCQLPQCGGGGAGSFE